MVLRCEGNNHEPRKYETFAAVALAGIGNLPDTITDRAVLIQMRRRKPEEKVEPFRYRDHEMEGLEIGDSLAVWAEDMAEMAAEHRPETDLVDRPADVWEPLLTVAEIAEGLWPQRARFASVAFTKSEITVQSIGVELLGDIRTVWPLGSSAVASQSLVNILCGDPEMRWGELNGKGLSARGLAMLLKPFSVLSQRTDKARIYSLNDFADPWTRYLPPPVA